jgi:hypothetical protein
MNFPFSNQSIKVTFSSSAGETFSLTYQLYDHCLRKRWVELMTKDKHKQIIEHGGFFFGKRFHSEKELEEKLNHCIEVINTYAEKFKFDEIRVPLKAQIPMSIEFLNTAHKYFEKIDGFKKLKIVREFCETIQDYNMTIHQAESFTDLGEFPSDHVQILLIPQGDRLLEEEDYKLFNPSNRFGELYLSYGMTGVPTKDAFLHKTEPAPQCVYTTGMMLSFMPDFDFNMTDEFEAWLRERGMTSSDPKSAIGLIPLGHLQGAKIENQDAFLNNLKKFRKVSAVEILNSEELPAQET